MAWREILARTMEGFQRQENVSPDWLVNPATRRRLKLDQLYPEVGLAVRFVGVTAKGQPRQSDWEELEEQQRDQTRAELCRVNGIELFLLDVNHAHPPEQLLQLRTILSRLSRLLAQSGRAQKDKAMLMPRLAEARSRLDQVTRRVRSADDLALYAELWRDRETAVAATAREPVTPRAKPKGKPRVYQPGQAVEHAIFGPGIVLSVNGSDDPQLIVQFADGRERTFLASLVADKLIAA
jgi:hypothetical protein